METILRPDLTRIVLTGSESTGKTTLAGQLATHFGVEYVPEFVRTFAAKKGGPLTMSDHGPIAKGQMALENEYAARAGNLLIQDTDLLSTVVYCRHYFGQCPVWIEETVVERMPALYLLMDIDLPWVHDGIRDRGDKRSDMHILFEDALNEFGMPYELIDGIDGERLEQAIAIVEEIL